MNLSTHMPDSERRKPIDIEVKGQGHIVHPHDHNLAFVPLVRY